MKATTKARADFRPLAIPLLCGCKCSFLRLFLMVYYGSKKPLFALPCGFGLYSSLGYRLNGCCAFLVVKKCKNQSAKNQQKKCVGIKQAWRKHLAKAAIIAACCG